MSRLCIAITGILLLGGLAPGAATAATITTNEAGMDAIFQQGALDIDIRFNAAVKVVGPTFLGAADTQATILTLAPTVPANTVVMFFLDAISWCGSYSASIAGCAFRPGEEMFLESSVAAGAFGAELNSHELGHNLGLPHSAGSANLMWGTLNGDTTLSVSQMNTILASPLVQSDAFGSFISITPVLLTPEPGTLALLALGTSGLAWASRRRIGVAP